MSIHPLHAQPKYPPPSLTPSQIPSAFTAEWGNYFLSSSVYGFDEYNTREWITDGCLNLGFGIGNPRENVAVEIDYNIESLRGVENGGSMDLRFSRSLISNSDFRLSLGAGWLAALSHGGVERKGDSPYGALTAAWPLRPRNGEFRQTMQVTAGVGGGRLQKITADPDDLAGGVFVSAGVELAANVGLSAGWTGRGLNAGLSLVPVRGQPLTLTLSGINLTNTDNAGRAAAFTVTWGGNFRTASY